MLHPTLTLRCVPNIVLKAALTGVGIFMMLSGMEMGVGGEVGAGSSPQALALIP